MRTTQLSFALLMLIAVEACEPVPYLQLRHPETATLGVSRPRFDAAGLRATVTGLVCTTRVEEHWCPQSEPECLPKPIVVREEATDCPGDSPPERFVLRTPWQIAYTGTFHQGALAVMIDWRTVDIDSLPTVKLRTDWAVHADAGASSVEGRWTLSDDELGALLAAIRQVTGNDYTEAPAGEPAAVAVAVSSESRNASTRRVFVSVTGKGPKPAYRVRANAKPVAGQLSGGNASFGRIDPGETKKREIDLAVVSNGQVAPLDVEVTSSNAPAVAASEPVAQKSKPYKPVALHLSCAPPSREVIAGYPARIVCEVDNPGPTPTSSVTYKVAVGAAAPVLAPGPAELAPNASRSKFGIDVAVPRNTAPAPLKVVVMVDAPDSLPARQEVLVSVVAPPKVCHPGEGQETLTAKKQAVENRWKTGGMSKQKRNDMVVELWQCGLH